MQRETQRNLFMLGLCGVALPLVSTLGCSGGAPSDASSSADALTNGATVSLVDFTGLCLQPAGGSSATGTRIELAPCTGAASEQWTFQNGTFVGLAGKCLDVQFSGTADGTPVQLWDCNGTGAQQWTPKKGELVGVGGNCLDVAAFNSVVGQTMETWTCNGGANQRFHFGKIGAGPVDAGVPDSGGSVADSASPDAGSTEVDSGTNPGTGVLAVGATTFLSSLGVNTHVDQGYDATQYVTPLQYTGIRNIREGERNLSSDIMLHQQAGILVNVNGGADLTGVLAAAKTLAASGALLSLEGPNEPNNFPITYNGQQGGGAGTWLPVAQFQRDLYSAVKGDSTLAPYPVFSVSEEGAEVDDVGLQFLTIPSGAGASMPDGTAYADYANPHNYVSSTNGSLYEDNMAWQAADPTLNGPWDGLYVEYGVTWNKQYQGYTNAELPGVPRVTTETGWDSVSNPGGERVQGVVLVNTYLAQFTRNWRYTFIYELVDGQGSTGAQGLYRSDLSAKPAADFIHNMTTILADGSSVASPGRLNYSIPSEPATVHDLLLQKSDSTFELVVWGENASATSDVTVGLGVAFGTVNVYDVTAGTTPTQVLSNVASVPLSLTDHALIVEVKP